MEEAAVLSGSGADVVEHGTIKTSSNVHQVHHTQNGRAPYRRETRDSIKHYGMCVLPNIAVSNILADIAIPRSLVPAGPLKTMSFIRFYSFYLARVR